MSDLLPDVTVVSRTRHQIANSASLELLSHAVDHAFVGWCMISPCPLFHRSADRARAGHGPRGRGDQEASVESTALNHHLQRSPETDFVSVVYTMERRQLGSGDK